jgi:hypothetical protein
LIVHHNDNNQGSNDDSPVTVIVTRKAKKGKTMKFEEWMDGIIHEAVGVEGPVRLSRLEIQQRSAALQVERHRNLVVRDEPVVVDLPKARRRPKPEIGPAPVLQRAAYPIEAVPKSDIITHGDGEVANLVTERMLVHRKGVYPVFPFCFCSHVLLLFHSQRQLFPVAYSRDPQLWLR